MTAPKPQPDMAAEAPSLPWICQDRLGGPLLIRHAGAQDAAAWITHTKRITQESPWMLQAPEDPLPGVGEQKGILKLYAERAGSLAIGAWVGHGRKSELVGNLTLLSGRSQRNLHSSELSMGIQRAYWGRGIGQRLMLAALHIARNNATTLRINLSVFADNIAARNLYLKHGFREEGNLRRFVAWRDPEGGPQEADLIEMSLWLGAP